MIRMRALFHCLAMVITMSLLAGCAGSLGDFPVPPHDGARVQGGMAVGQPQDYATGGLAQPEAMQAPVKVGLILPLSGPQGQIGRAMEQAAQLALFDMGQANFTLVPRDTGGTAQGAQRAAQMVVEEGAQVILGPLLAEEVRAAKTALRGDAMPMIAFSTDWSQAGNNTYIMGFLPFVQVARVTDYAARQGVRTVAYIAPRDSYGDTAVRAFEQEAARQGMTVVARIRYSGSSDPTLAGQIQALAQNKNIQAVFIPVGGMKADEISSTLSFHGLTPDKVMRLGTGLWDDDTLAMRASMQGAVFAAPSPRQYALFEAKYRSVYGSAPPRIASLAYDATALAAVLARQGGAQGFTQAALKNPNGFAGMDGIFRFNSQGMVERGLAILQIDNRRLQEIDRAPPSFVR